MNMTSYESDDKTQKLNDDYNTGEVEVRCPVVHHLHL
jgi:hypothetical protein